MMDFPIPYLTLQALGFATGTALCWLMAGLLWKSKNPAGVRRLEIAMPLVGSLWTTGSFATQMVLLAGIPMQSRAFGWSFVAAWTSVFVMPSLWLRIRDQTAARPPRFRRALLAASTLGAAALTVSLPASILVRGFPAKPGTITILSAYSAMLHAAVILFAYGWERSSPTARFVVRVVLPLIAVEVILLIVIIHFSLSGSAILALAFVSQQALIPNIIVVASFMAKFRYADVLLKRSLNVISSVILASIAVWWIPGVRQGIPVVVGSLAGAGLLMAAPPLYRFVSWLVDRGLLRPPRYGDLTRTFAEESGRVGSERELFALTEKRVSDALHVESVRIAPASGVDVTAGTECIPVNASHARYVLLIPPTVNGRRLLQEETIFLDAISREVGRKLDAMEFERERRERQISEQRLQHSLTEAELKALRAQVDPHFLFNTLNTIADLITSDPAKAEAMTERLAEFFRYTLTRTERTLATLDEELQFVRQYLDIEQVRFGGRLRVELSAAADLGKELVPALILQPLVENAIRHGLAPKPGGGRISVSAVREGGFLRIQVADDGVGIGPNSRHGTGVGLQNVRERLSATYGDAARMSIDTGLSQGTCVSLLLPGHDS